MNKQEYISQLRTFLSSLSYDEREAAIRYYEEFFDDAGVENEQAIIKELGTPKKLSETILSEHYDKDEDIEKEMPYQNNVEQNINTNGAYQDPYQQTCNNKSPSNNNWIWIVVLICTAPVTIPILIGAGGLIIGLIGGLIGLAVGIFAAAFGLVISGIVAIGFGIASLFVAPASSLVYFGVGLILASIGLVILLLAIQLMIKVFPAFIRLIVNLFNNIFNRNKVTV